MAVPAGTVTSRRFCDLADGDSTLDMLNTFDEDEFTS